MSEEQPDYWTVLVNYEEQYALFPASLPPPAGWREAGFSGTADDCKDFVDREWTDMRPLSLRRAMNGHANSE